MTTTSEAEFSSAEDRCITCGNTHDWHEKNNPRHEFNDGTVSWKDTFKPKRGMERPGVNTPPAFPFDPVLRQALIDKSVLTVEDIQAAEAKIRTITQAVMGGSGYGQSPASTRRGQVQE